MICTYSHRSLERSIFIITVLVLLILNLSSIPVSAKKTEMIPASDPGFYYSGRIDYSNPKSLRFSYPGVSISAKFESSFCIIHLKNKGIGRDEEGNPWKNFYQIIVDGQVLKSISVADGQTLHRLDLGPGIHTLTIFKRTESSVGEGVFEGLEIEAGKKLLPYNPDFKLKMEFIGNSITCGYGNEGDSKDCKFTPDTENNYMAYGAITARNLGAEYVAVAYSGKGVCQNYDTTDKVTTPMFYPRVMPHEENLHWDFKKYQPDIVVMNIGTNDFAHAAPPMDKFVNAYVGFLQTIRLNYPQAKIVCTLGPMTTDFWPVGVKALTTSKKYINMAVEKMNDKSIMTYFFVPQTAEDFGCDFHPNTKRHIKMADELTEVINKFLKE